ncbi:putative protease [Pyrobaculum oguniense TE7]|uniref:Protease n=1 Tax=Pyrobaculum oguniense (strain DSM 13380 / JCM 10595 / TE7) TaxID=698757 RepID=H6QB81_PYROT|nr:putative protease [Pyrobaculum oguniense TE7]
MHYIKPSLKTVLLFVLIVATIVSAQAVGVMRNPDSPPTLVKFVGNLTGADERFITVVVLKKGVPSDVAERIYSAVSQMYTREFALNVRGKSIAVREVRVSNLVKDREGRYVFKVFDRLVNVERAIAPFRDYVERIAFKPIPNTLEKLPDLLPGDKAIAPTNAIIRDLIGVSQVESRYGVTGRGINIAVVDTGVDYGHPDLTPGLVFWQGAYKGDTIREPLVLDADQQQVLLLQDVISVTNGSTTFIYVGGRYYTVLVPWSVSVYPPCDYYTLPTSFANQFANGSKFGVTYMYRYDGIKIVGVLMMRQRGADYYTHVLVDVNRNCDFSDEIATAPPYTNPYGRGGLLRYLSNRVIAPDYNRNGYPDDSLGVAGGFFYDFGWWFSYPGEIHPGWDRQGRWLSIFYDFDGHGTAAASAAAGRGVVMYNISGLGVVRLRGMAPEAGIIGVKGLWMGNVEVGMLWAAGFDVDPYTGRIYYTGSKRAHIISNSWGISTFIYDFGAFGYDFESIFVAGLALPGFLDPRYPGILIVHAGGNGGPGYGTITSPGASVGVLTVGASTSTHFAYAYSKMSPSLAGLYMSGAGWSSDEIISWALRGPTVVGYNKPDVVNVGAFGFTADVVPFNYTIFGGTSYATPLTAGVAALVYQVLGPNADPSRVKAVIVSTADWLRYDVASSGSGRVNAYRAVSLARLLTGQNAGKYELLVSSNSLWSNYMSKASNIWYWQWCDNIPSYMLWSVGTELTVTDCRAPSSATTRIDVSLFFGDVPQGGSRSISFTITNPTNRTVEVQLSPRQFIVSRTQVFERRLSLAPNVSSNRTYILFTSSNLTATYRYVAFIVSIPYSSVDPDNNYRLNLRTRVWIHLWRADTNSNGRPDPDEMVLVNYGYNYYGWNLATIANPTARLAGNRGIVVSVDLVRGPDTPSSQAVPLVPVKITVVYIDTASDPWVSASPSTARISPGGSATFTLRVAPPSTAIPTTYIGEVIIVNNVTSIMSIPYTFNVYTTVGTTEKLVSLGSGNRWPFANQLGSANDWAWRYEAGDWRWFFAKPVSDNGLAFLFEARWINPDTSLIAYAIGPDGQFAGSYYGQGASWHDYLGSGVFVWVNTGAGSIQNAKRVVIFPAVEYRDGLYPHSKPETGVFTFVVRTGEFDGRGGAFEPFNATLRLIPATSKLPATAVSGGSFAIRFSLPYIAGPIYAFATRPFTPRLDIDQNYAGASYYMSPSYISGTYPSGTPFTFQLSAYLSGVSGQRVDISALFEVRMPSLPVVYRWYNSYYRETDWYLFEDWIRLLR